MTSQSLQFYVDTLIIESILSNPRLSKEAQSGMVSSMMQKVFNYAHEKMQEFKDSDHKIEMITNFLIPGMLTAFGFPLLGFISKVAEMMFHINFAKILEEIAGSIKSLLTGGKQTSSEEVDKVISSIVTNNVPTNVNNDDINRLIPENERVISSKLNLREALFIKIAFADYAEKNPNVNLVDPEINIKFAAGLFQSALGTFVSSRHKTTKIIISVLGWMVKAILAAGGFMVAGDIINHIVGGSTNGVDGTVSSSPKEELATSVTTGPTQTVFAPSPTYIAENNNGPGARWMIQTSPNNIGPMLLSWALEIYPQLHGQESVITSARTFNAVVQTIQAYNAGGPPDVTFIPRLWKSRKQVVDNFMNEVALTAHPPNNTSQIPNWHPSKDAGPGISI